MSKKLTLDEFINRANLKHNNKYIYDKVEYINIDIKINIICLIHGNFWQTPHNHLNGSECPKCRNDERSNNYKKQFEDFVKQANLIHNYKFKYFEPYKNTHTKIIIECPKHGLFKQKPVHHLHGHGCSRCTQGSNISKKESAWLDGLEILENYRQTTIKINNFFIKVDAYDPTKNIVYEFYGDYWHGNPSRFLNNDLNKIVKKTFGELYQKTLERENLIKSAGYNLVSIWESDWKNKVNE